MKRIQWFILVGTVLLVSGFSLLALGSTPTQAQGRGPDYAGSSECSSCHRNMTRTHETSLHALTLQNAERDEEALLADFGQGEDIRTVQFPGEDSARPFTADDIAYAVGTGRYVQRYLYQVGDDDYRVLPAEWNVATASWQPLTLADSWDDPAYDWEQSCADCHTTGFNVERARWEEDGVQCEGCHGPAEEHLELVDEAGRRPSDEEMAEIRASVNLALDPQVCGQCHSVGTSAEGQPFATSYLPGGDLSEGYTLSASEDTAHWWVTGHGSHMNMQYNEWLNSGHSQSLAALADIEGADESCLTCHSADYVYTERIIEEFEEGDREGEQPESLTPQTALYGVTCASCHNPHSEDEALPANLVAEPYPLCTSCHSNTSIPKGIHHPSQEMFEGVALVEGVEAVPGAHFTAEDGPDCLTCHMPEVPVSGGQRISHTFEPVLPGAALNVEGMVDSCSSCHEEIVDAASMQSFIEDVQASTQARIDNARAAVTDSTPAWVVQALDFVEGDGSLGIHNYAYADAVLDAVFTELGLSAAAE